ncbi:hypothetical protein EVA_12695 [gut metagenome]|uniref:Uncharacterized protein n=1 Tax=gut metagenome TaxID=749906 RepID=J9FXD2_9ZZZZ
MSTPVSCNVVTAIKIPRKKRIVVMSIRVSSCSTRRCMVVSTCLLR